MVVAAQSLAMPKRRPRPPRPVMRDHVDQLIEGWAAERPDLDTAAVGVVYRLTRIAAVWNAEIERLFASYGITSTDFAVLANLRRTGSPYQLNQRQLMTALRLTSGTVSLRIEKMVERGLVTRAVDPSDARAAIVTLTAEGAALFDVVAPEHLANERRLIASLPEVQQGQLAGMLRAILLDIEQPAEARPDHALGFTAAPTLATQRKRAEVGLPPQPGLLVESVERGGAADRAGVRPGDMVTRVGDVAVCSLACLERAIGAGGAPLVATLVRGGASTRIELERPGP